MVQFECDTCIFLKLKQRLPDPLQTQYKLLMACIRRANLDAFWSRATSTVTSNARLIDESADLVELVGIDPPLVPMGPLPAGDHCGYGMAVLILLKSRIIHRTNNGKRFGSSRRPTEIRSGQALSRTARVSQWGMPKENITPECVRTLAPRCGSRDL
jgi:hypothetical protein